MPTYEYACTECDHSFEQVQSFSDDALTVCPQCQGRLRKVFNAVGVVFKGSGFYRTDSRSADASAQSEGKQSEGKQSEGKQNGKQSDGKPAKTGESGGDSGGGSGGDSGGDKTSSTEKPAAKTGSGEKASSPKDSSSAA